MQKKKTEIRWLKQKTDKISPLEFKLINKKESENSSSSMSSHILNHTTTAKPTVIRQCQRLESLWSVVKKAESELKPFICVKADCGSDEESDDEPSFEEQNLENNEPAWNPAIKRPIFQKLDNTARMATIEDYDLSVGELDSEENSLANFNKKYDDKRVLEIFWAKDIPKLRGVSEDSSQEVEANGQQYLVQHNYEINQRGLDNERFWNSSSFSNGHEVIVEQRNQWGNEETQFEKWVMELKIMALREQMTQDTLNSQIDSFKSMDLGSMKFRLFRSLEIISSKQAEPDSLIIKLNMLREFSSQSKLNPLYCEKKFLRDLDFSLFD